MGYCRIRADRVPQFDPYESLANVFTDQARMRPAKAAEVPVSAGGGLSRMSMLTTLWPSLNLADVLKTLTSKLGNVMRSH